MNHAEIRSKRRHAHENDAGQRTPFQRDRDAVLYTTAFRRLGGVTQVVSPGEGTIYHNRLTHTLEVAQIAQRLAQYLCEQNPASAGHLMIDPDVVEASALIHDLGHPPFGHVAEHELNNLLLSDGILCGYEGNAQSFRIITKLAIRQEKNSGLDLTVATLNASLKYPWLQEPEPNDPTKQKKKKWGSYKLEYEDFEFARQLHKQDESKSVEAQIMDWADDIAYSIHDTEDFYRAGLIPLGLLAQSEEARRQFVEAVFDKWDQKNLKPEYKDAEKRAKIRKIFEVFCTTLSFVGPYEPTTQMRSQVRLFTSQHIGRYILATELRDEPDEGSWLQIPEEVRMEVEFLKELTWQYVIKGRSLAGIQYGHRKIIRSLYRVFKEAIKEDKLGPLPARDRARVEQMQREGKINESDQFRMAVDAISGMTDQQAILMHHRLTGTSPGSILESIII